ncbi:MAG: DNA polymerase III subunit delta, partial [Rikenellaceae bacterium]
TVLILCYKGKNMDKRSALYKKISKNGFVFESLSPKSYELEGFVRGFMQGKRVNCDAKGVSMLCEFIGANLSKIDNEVDKVVSVLPDENRTLTPELIEKYIGVSKEYNVFELTKALSDRNIQAAVRIGKHFAQNPKNYPFVVTVSVLFNHFQRLIILSLMRWESQRRGTPAPRDSDYARAMGVSPYLVKEYLAASARYSLKSLFAIISLLREYDMKGKGVDCSMDEGSLLDELILLILVA